MGRLRPQVWPLVVVVGGGGWSILSLLFLDQAIVVPPGQVFTKNRDFLKGSKVGHLSRIPALPKDEPQVMEDKSDYPVCQNFAKKGYC